MITRVLADELGIIRTRHETSTSRRVSFRIRRHGHCPKKPTRNVEYAEFVLPLGNCTWTIVLCTIMDLGVSSATSTRLLSATTISPATVDTMAAASTALQVATPTRQLPSVPASIVSVVSHPCCNNGDILKRIPKDARSATASLLLNLILDVLQHPLSTPSWSKLLGFSSACLAKPNQGGKSRNVTTQIVKQISQYDQGVAELPSDSIGFNHPHRTNQPENATKP